MSVISAGPSRSPAVSLPQAHALAAAGVALAAGVAGLIGPPAPASVVAAGLAVAVAVVGLPHGGLDHLAGRAVFRPSAGAWWPLPFLLSYLAVGAAVVAGWVVAPLATAALFFALSAAHFAETERGPWLRRVLFGSLGIWLPLLARPAESATLLTWVAPTGVEFAEALLAWRPLLIGLAVAGAVTWAADLLRAFADADRDALVDGVRLAAFAAMFALAPVVVGFAVAFAGWHSAAELARLATRADPGRPVAGLRRVMLVAAPLSLAAALLTAVGAFALGGRAGSPGVVQAVFLGLSAVAVPHILLHTVAGRRAADPFATGGDA